MTAVEIFNTALKNCSRLELFNNMFQNMLNPDMILKLMRDWYEKFGSVIPADENTPALHKAVEELYAKQIRRSLEQTLQIQRLIELVKDKLPESKLQTLVQNGICEQTQSGFMDSIIYFNTFVLGPVFRAANTVPSELKLKLFAEICECVGKTDKEIQEPIQIVDTFLGTRTYDEEKYKALIGNTIAGLMKLYYPLYALRQFVSPGQFGILVGNLPQEMRTDMFYTGRYKPEELKKFTEILEDAAKRAEFLKCVDEAFEKITSLDELDKFTDTDQLLLPAATAETQSKFDLPLPIIHSIVWTAINAVWRRTIQRIVTAERKAEEAKALEEIKKQNGTVENQSGH